MKGLRTAYLCFLAAGLSGCGPEGIPTPFGLDGAPELAGVPVVTLERRQAAQIPCDAAQFERLKPILTAHGFNQWGTFNGIAGIPGRVIIPLTKEPLAYSFKYENGTMVNADIFRPVVIYDAENQILYFIMCTDFGG